MKTSSIAIIIILVLLLGIAWFVSNFGIILEEQKPQFDVDQTLMKVLIKTNESLSRTINIMNTGENVLNFKMDPSASISEILRISENSFELKPGQSKSITIIFSSRLDSIEYLPDVYVGKIEVTTGSFTHQIPVVVEIETTYVLFDTNLNSPPQYRRTNLGNETLMEVKLFNLHGIEPTSVKMEYHIKDLNGNTIITESETVVVATQTTFTKTFRIPEYLKTGTYVFSVSAIYGSSVGTSSYLFEIVSYRPTIISPEIVNMCINNTLCLFGVFLIVIVVLTIGSFSYLVLKIKGKPRVVVRKVIEKPKPGFFERWKTKKRRRRREFERIKRLRERKERLREAKRLRIIEKRKIGRRRNLRGAFGLKSKAEKKRERLERQKQRRLRELQIRRERAERIRQLELKRKRLEMERKRERIKREKERERRARRKPRTAKRVRKKSGFFKKRAAKRRKRKKEIERIRRSRDRKEKLRETRKLRMVEKKKREKRGNLRKMFGLKSKAQISKEKLAIERRRRAEIAKDKREEQRRMRLIRLGKKRRSKLSFGFKDKTQKRREIALLRKRERLEEMKEKRRELRKLRLGERAKKEEIPEGEKGDKRELRRKQYILTMRRRELERRKREMKERKKVLIEKQKRMEYERRTELEERARKEEKIRQKALGRLRKLRKSQARKRRVSRFFGSKKRRK